MGNKTLGDRVLELEARVKRLEEEVQSSHRPLPRLEMSVVEVPVKVELPVKRGPGRPRLVQEDL